MHQHQQRTHTLQPQQCTECGQTYKSIYSLEKHLNNMHQISKSIGCNECDKMFKSSDQLERHVLIMHRNLRPFVCPECGSKHSNCSNLNKHRRKSHQVENKVSRKSLSQMILDGQHPFCDNLPEGFDKIH